jgi:16S rRNA processing protein RimM
MKKDDCFLFGKIIKTHGFKGELIVSVRFAIPGIFEKTKFVFVDIEGLLVPFFHESVQGSGNSLNIKFDDVDDVEKSRRLCGCDLWLQKEYLPEKIKNQSDIIEYKGFRVVDQQKGEIGLLQDVLEMPQQQMLQIRNGSKEILIPVAEEIIVEIDKKNKAIHIDAPEGLIDMYLNSKSKQ